MGGAEIVFCDTLRTPIGTIAIRSNHHHLLEIYPDLPCQINPNEITDLTKQLLISYFEGSQPDFRSIPFCFSKSPFFERVYRALLETAYGSTLSYSELAALAGNAKAHRAAATAVAKNRYLIAVPCHRVLHKSGGVGRYGAGKEKKAWLLHHERTQ